MLMNAGDREEEIFTTAQAARYLHVHAVTVKRWIAKGALEAYREPGGRWRIPLKSLIQFVEQRGMQVVLPARESITEKTIRVLIADDEDKVRSELRRVLEENISRVEIQEAEDGLSTCIELGRGKPDLLILDIRMPHMDGLRVAQLIAESTDLQSTQVIVLSGFIDEKTMRDFHAMGVEAFLDKPVQEKDLLNTIEYLLDLDKDRMPRVIQEKK